MKLHSLQISDFRNLSNIDINLDPSLNVFVGVNGSGKSSLLEAIHYLGYGRSFRSSKHHSVIQHGKSKFVVHAKMEDVINNKMFSTGLSRSDKDDVTVSINGYKDMRLADLVSLIPIQIFTPQSSDVVIGAPGLRRKFLDWVVFHVEHSFNEQVGYFNKALKQRNALLKGIQRSGNLAESDRQQIDYWTQAITTYGNALDEARRACFDRLKPYFLRNFERFITEFSVEISYHRGWQEGSDLYDELQGRMHTDLKYGYTSIGPQKCDLLIKADGMPAAEILSRGQLRMLVAALQLSQSEFLSNSSRKQTLFLLDDISAELDESKRETFVDMLLACGSQLMLTAIDNDQLAFLRKHKNKKMFHVEHGQVNEE
ncbi:DNA replication/repair protein RecF [Aestuariibacter salexigens]|uniref:DNA replication/repair protein RecF n=1 Tax=Aestuariibacter salexigens TaxID=226010 RepID=UPI00040EFD5B|nr:DNA replication/repair protein RecF [Aestuariibacter salexigens]